MIADSILVANNRSIRNLDNINANLNYRYKGEKRSIISIDLDYGVYESDNYTSQPNEYWSPESSEILTGRYFENLNDTKIDIRTAKADYEINLGKGRLSTGIKFSSVITDNAFSQFNATVENPEPLDRSAIFEYTEFVSAGYINYSVKLGEK